MPVCVLGTLADPAQMAEPKRSGLAGCARVNVNVIVNVEFKVTLHEQVRYRGPLQSVTQTRVSSRGRVFEWGHTGVTESR